MSEVQGLLIANIVRLVEQLHGFETVEKAAEQRDADADNHVDEPINDLISEEEADSLLAMNGDPPPQLPTTYSHAPREDLFYGATKKLLRGGEKLSVSQGKSVDDSIKELVELVGKDGVSAEDLAKGLYASVAGISLSTDMSAVDPVGGSLIGAEDSTFRASFNQLRTALEKGSSDMFSMVTIVTTFLTNVAAKKDIKEGRFDSFCDFVASNPRDTKPGDAMMVVVEATVVPADTKLASAERRAKAISAALKYFYSYTNKQNSLAFCVSLVALAALAQKTFEPFLLSVVTALSNNDDFYMGLASYTLELAETSPTTDTVDATVSTKTTLSIKSEGDDEWRVPVTMFKGTKIAIEAAETKNPVKIVAFNSKVTEADVKALESQKKFSFANAVPNTVKAIQALTKTIDTPNDIKSAEFEFAAGSAQKSTVLIARGKGDVDLTIEGTSSVSLPSGWMGMIVRAGTLAALMLSRVRLGDINTQVVEEDRLDEEPAKEGEKKEEDKKEEPKKDEEEDEKQELTMEPLLREGLLKGDESNDGFLPFKVLDNDPSCEALIKKFNALCRITESQRDSARSVLAVALCHLPEAVAIQELQQRWMIDWAPQLQGHGNAGVRQYLANLCKFLVTEMCFLPVSESFVNGFGPGRKSAQVMNHLRVLLTAHHKLNDVKTILRQRREAAERIEPTLQTLEKLLLESSSRQAVALTLLSTLHRNGTHYLHDVAGCGSDVEERTRTALFGLVKAISATSASVEVKNVDDAPSSTTDQLFLALAAQDHPFTTDDLQLMSTIPELRAKLLETASASLQASSAAEGAVTASSANRLIRNEFFTTKAAVHVVITPKGLQVDRTGMDVCSLRGTGAWPIKDTNRTDPRVMYFEVKLLSKNIKRMMIGACAPQCNVEEFDPRTTQKSLFSFDSGSKAALSSLLRGDVVGCGVNSATKEVFFTLNGNVILTQELMDAEAVLYPFLTYETTDRSSVLVNFGSGPFTFRYQNQVLPAGDLLSVRDVIAQAVQVVGKQLRQSARVGSDKLLDEMLDDTLKILAKVTKDSAADAIQLAAAHLADAVRFVADSPRITGARARKIGGDLLKNIASFPEAVARYALQIIESVIMKYPSCFPAGDLTSLLKYASGVAEGKPTAGQNVPFLPCWSVVNDENSYANAQIVKVTKEHKYTHAIGNALPNEGVCTFSMVVSHSQAEVDSMTMLGHFYVGVTCANIGTLGSGSWKTASPPNVWALHSRLESQLSHADEATLGNDPYVFTNGSIVNVTVDRDKGTVSFQRGGRTFNNVFVDLPRDIELRPFVQVVGEYAVGTILPGTRSAAVSNATLLSGAAVSLMRAMLCIPASAAMVSDTVATELTNGDAKSVPWRSLAVIGAGTDPRAATLKHNRGNSMVRVLNIIGSRATVAIEGMDPLEVDLSQLHAADVAPFASLQLREEDDDFIPEDTDDDEEYAPRRTADGIKACCAAVAKFIANWGVSSVGKSLLLNKEYEARREIELSEAEAFRSITTHLTAHQFDLLHGRNGALMSGVLQATPTPQTYTFNRRDTSPEIGIPSHYDGKLALSSMDNSGKVSFPLVAIANEAIPRTGVTSIRVKFEMDWMGLIPQIPGQMRPMAPGCYFGVCLGSYHGTKREHALVSPPDMWAVTSRDDKQHHLPHSCEAMKEMWFMFSRDTIRLQIDRRDGSLTAYRSPANGKELCLGKLFDNIPPEVELYPFVQFSAPRASAMFLPENAALPRQEQNDVRFAHKVNSKDHYCDGCVAQLVSTKVEAPNWYRCNQFADYDLCRQCFQNHVHPGHTFTNMRAASFVRSPILTADTGRNAACEIAAVPARLVEAHNCVVNEEKFGCEMTTSSTNGKCVWGLLRRAGGNAALECHVSFDGVQHDESSIIVVGVAPFDFVFNKTVEEVLKSAQQGSDVFLMVNDENRDIPGSAKVHPTRQTTRGFSLQDRLSFTLSGTSITLAKNGSTVRSLETSWNTAKLCAFAFVQEVGITVTCLPPTEFITGKVGEISQAHKLLRVTSGTANRWCAASDVHTPLAVAKTHSVLKPGQKVYVARPSRSDLVACYVTKIGAADEPIAVSDGDESFMVGIEAIYVANNENSPPKDEETSLYPEVKARMRRFYKKWAPEKSEADMDKAIDMYARAQGGHEKMFAALIQKYGPEPEEVVTVPRKDSSGNVGGISYVESYTVSRLLFFMLNILRSNKLVADLASDYVRQMGSTISMLASIPVSMENAGSNAVLRELERSTATAFRQMNETLHFPTTLVSPSPLAVGDAVLVPCGEQQNAVGVVEAVKEDSVSVKVGDKVIKIRRDAAVPTHVIDGKHWSEASPATMLQLPTMATTSWSGIMRSPNGNSFEVTVDGSRGVGKIFGTPCLVGDLTVDPIQRTFAFVMANIDDKATLEELERRMVSFVSSRATRKRQCPKSKVGAVCLGVQGVFRNDGTVEITWTLPSGNSGPGTLISSEDKAAKAATAPLLCDISNSPPDEEEVQTEPLKEYIVRLALRIHAAAVTEVGLPASPAELLTELMNTRDSQLQLKLLRFAAEQSPEYFAAVVGRLLAVCHNVKSTRRQAITAAALLNSVVESSVDGCDTGSATAVFWEILRGSLSVAHRFVNSLSALSAVAPLVGRHSTKATVTLIAPLFTHFDALSRDGNASSKSLSIAASILSAVFAEAPYMADSKLRLKTLAFLLDSADSLRSDSKLPAVADNGLGASEEKDELTWDTCTKNAEVRGSVLIKGTVIGNQPFASNAVSYFETFQPESARLVIGLATEDYKNQCLAAEAFGQIVGIGYDKYSFGYDGTQTFHDFEFVEYGWVKIDAGDVIGCAVDMGKKKIRFSVNGEVFNELDIPMALRYHEKLYPVVQSNTNPGIKILSKAGELRHMPLSAVPLQTSEFTATKSYDSTKRSELDAKPVEFYVAVADYLESGKRSGVATGVDEDLLKRYGKQIELIEGAVRVAMPMIDLEGNDSILLRMFTLLKRVVRKSYRKDQLISIPSVEQKDNPRTLSQVTVRWYTLFSKVERTPEQALHHSVLGQLYRQMGSEQKMFEQNPMFMTALMMTDSGHVPIDAGGPYKQVWSLLSEEIMADSDRANFHRNPLFRFVSNSNGKRVVPDAKRTGALDLALFNFLGKIMGHMVRAKAPLAFEIAPFVWKFVAEDPITAEDMFEGLEDYWRATVDDDELLDSDGVSEYFPNFNEVFSQLSASPTHMQRLGEIQLRKKAAEHCLIHMLDAQLMALRSGLWSTLGKKTVRALTGEDLELLVCGEPNPTFEQVQGSITCSLPMPQQQYFWDVMKELSPKEWSDFFYFAAAQKRYPLTKKISVGPSGTSTKHLPVASTCFSQVTIPLYTSVEDMRAKLKQAIGCQDMELA